MEKKTMKKILLSIAALLFCAVFTAPAEVAAEEPVTITCAFTAQVINIDITPAWDAYDNPEVAGYVYFGYWKFNRSQSSKPQGVSTHQVFATKEWLSTLQAAYFDPRRPYIYVSSELYGFYSYNDCNSSFRGTVSYIKVNPWFEMQNNSGGGGGGGGKGGPAGPGKK